MTKNITLKAKLRSEKEKKSNQLRNEGLIPAVLYGQGGEAQSLKISLNDFVKAYELAGESSLLNLEVEGQDDLKVIIKTVQKDPVRNQFIHADIYKVDMKKKIEIEIPLNFVGEAKAEKELGGTLMKNHESITAQALPTDLIEHLDVDISGLETFDDSVKAEDLKLPEGIELLTNPSDSIVHVAVPKIQEEAEEAGGGTAEEKADEEKESGSEEEKTEEK